MIRGHCGFNEGPFRLGLVPAGISQLIVVDVQHYHRNREKCQENIQNIASALLGMHV